MQGGFYLVMQLDPPHFVSREGSRFMDVELSPKAPGSPKTFLASKGEHVVAKIAKRKTMVNLQNFIKNFQLRRQGLFVLV